jgi:adenylate cyclase
MLTMTEPVLPEGMSGEQVRDALARVSAHKTFAGASRLRKLLEYVVEQSLAGHGDELKEYTIATSVLDKPEEFDPQTDSIVRVMFGRVRNGLQLYYATDGAADPVHIIIPLGGYQPQFVAVHDHDEISAPAPTPARNGGKPNRRSLLAVCGLIGLGLLASWAWLERPATPPLETAQQETATRIRLLVQHLRPLPAGSPSPLTSRLASGLSGELVSDMLAYPWMHVVQLPETGEPLSDISNLKGSGDGFDYALSGSVAADGGTLTVTMRLQDIPSLKVKWSRTWQHEATSNGTGVEEFQRRMLSEIAGQLASEKGLLPQLAIARKGPERNVDYSGFQCFLGIYQYWDAPTADAHRQLRTCLQGAVAQNPAYADAWAALAYIYIDEQRYGRNPREGADSWADATDAVSKALALEPTNPVVLGAAMTLAIEQPQRDVAAFHKYGRQSLDLRPNDSFALANYGMKRAIYLGEWADGLEQNRRAHELTLSPVGWYHLLPAFDAVRTGNADALRQSVSLLPPSHSIAANMMRAISAHLSGERDQLTAIVNRLRADGITGNEAARRYIRNRRFEPALQQALETGFTAAFEAASTS